MPSLQPSPFRVHAAAPALDVPSSLMIHHLAPDTDSAGITQGKKSTGRHALPFHQVPKRNRKSAKLSGISFTFKFFWCTIPNK
jgi:hypothetical protein